MSPAEKPILTAVPPTALPCPAPAIPGGHQSTGEEWLTLEECAAWLRLTPAKVSLLSKGPRPAIPACWINARLVRFHKPTVIAQLTDPERALKAFGTGSRQRRNPTRR
ncbi:MAG: hypothetical protein H7A46_26865 [Verrucomicrobiales bacterium]|nr:hypothetical protein [Verrucomicrobiales bacterium]